MKITNPSVTLKDGLWYGYTANSEGALVKISNQEEVEKYVRIVNAWEAYKTTDKWNPKPGAIYKLDGYVMEVSEQRRYMNHMTNTWSKWYDVEPIWAKQSMIETMRVATISPIQKQEPERIKINDIFYVEGHERSHLCVGYQGVEMDPIAENGLPYQRSKCSLKPFPNFEKYSAYKQSETVATSGTNYVAPDNHRKIMQEKKTASEFLMERLKDVRASKYPAFSVRIIVAAAMEEYATMKLKEKDKEIHRLKAKAEQWDALHAKMDKFYEDGSEADLMDIGEAAAEAFGYL